MVRPLLHSTQWIAILKIYEIVSSEMKLQPNIGSDRSWVWKVGADYAENPATPETLAIRFANSDSEFDDCAPSEETKL